MKNNRVVLSGTISGEPEFNHKTEWETFNQMMLAVTRRSGTVDEIPVLLSEHLMQDGIQAGAYVIVIGTYRSRNNNGHLELFVFADAVEIIELQEEDQNEVELHGFLCRKPIHRETPFGRKITDLLIAVNREAFGRSYYIPAICWGRIASCLADKPVGTELTVHGRIQSRKYMKKLDDGSAEERTAWEVSVNTFEMGGENHDKE